MTDNTFLGPARVEYQVYEKESGMTVAWADNLKDALHYLSVYNQDFPHGLYEVTYKEMNDDTEENIPIGYRPTYNVELDSTQEVFRYSKVEPDEPDYLLEFKRGVIAGLILGPILTVCLWLLTGS